MRYLLVTIITLTLSAFSAQATNGGLEQIAPEKQTIKVKKQKRPKPKIYREDASYNKLIDEMLVIVQQAKSNNKIVIENIYQELYQWHNTRQILEPKLERSFRYQEFHFFSYLLTKLERYDEIINLYYVMYPKNNNLGIGHANLLANASIKNGTPEQAIDLLTEYVDQGREITRSIYSGIIIHAYWAANDDQKVLETADKLIAYTKQTQKRASSTAYRFKYHAYSRMNDLAQANKVKEQIWQIFSSEHTYLPELLKSSPVLLRHLPEAY